MLEWCRKNCADERKPGETEEQFLYKTRKKAHGPFKRQLWSLPEENRARYGEALVGKFRFLFEQLGCRGSRPLVDLFVQPVLVHKPAPEALVQALGAPVR
jgi:hypothetical protein